MDVVLQNIGAVISFILGFIAIFWPAKTESFTSVRGQGKEGNSEVRATYDGFFLAISLFAISTQMPVAFQTLGIGWLGAALIRLFTLCFGYYTRKNLGGVVFEGLIGLLCISSLFV
jgi:hypothetical protein